MAPPSQAGTPTEPTDRRALLIEAAGALFTERAYDEVSTSEIAKRAGVAYGLIAHHFANKRGLYLATVTALAERMQAVHELPPAGDTPRAQLRDVLTRHVSFIEDNAGEFAALMRGAIGSDPEVRAIIDQFRWRGVRCLLCAFGVEEPYRAALRTAARGWSMYVDEAIVDYLRHRDLSREDLVRLGAAAFVAALTTAHAIDPGIGIDQSLLDALSAGNGDAR